MSDGPRFNRRHILALAAATGAAGSLAAGARVWSWWDRPPTEAYRSLSEDEVVLVDAICEAFFPPGGTPKIGGADVRAARYMDDVLGTMVDPMGDLLRLVLHVLDDWSRVSRRSGFAALSIEERGEVIQSLSRHRSHLVRGAITGLTIFICSAYTTHPDVIRAVGWKFPCGYER